MNERKQQIRADQWDTIAADVRAGRCVATFKSDDGYDILLQFQKQEKLCFEYLMPIGSEIESGVIGLEASDIITLEWHDAAPDALAAMAADPAVQRDIADIAAKFEDTPGQTAELWQHIARLEAELDAEREKSAGLQHIVHYLDVLYENWEFTGHEMGYKSFNHWLACVPYDMDVICKAGHDIMGDSGVPKPE